MSPVASRLLSRRIFALFIGAACALSSAAPAASTLALLYGNGDDTELVGISAQFSPWRALYQSAGWSLTPRIELGISALHGTKSGEDNRRIAIAGATPLLRLESQAAGVRPYAELGLGVRLLSRTSAYPSRPMSTAFQFGEFAGAGIAFGPDHAFELGLRVEHVSNGGIKRPNPGLTQFQVRLAYSFR